MARTRQIWNSLNSGEWSPLLEGRTDLQKYQSAARVLKNMLPLKFGGAKRRPGTHFAAEVKTSAKATALIPFEFSKSQAYIIEVGDTYMRFYKPPGRIENPPGTAVEIASPYLEADLFKISYAQSSDVLYLACAGYAPRKLVRTSDTVWTLSTVAFTSSPWGAGPFPAAVNLYEQRSWWANTTSAPDTLWGSQTGSYENLAQGTGLPDEGIEFTLSSRKLNAIEWLAGQRALIAGTAGQEHFISGGSPDEPITPSNPNAKAPTKYGSASVAPVEAGNAILFLQRAGRKLREILIDPSADAYTGPFADLSLLAEHITEGGIVQMAYQQELDSIVWAIRGGGALLSMTYERQQDVVAWARHFTGTAQDASDGKFESVAVIPHPDQDQDQAWVVVKRTIGGATKRYVEFLDTKGGFYGALNVDSAFTYSGAAVATITGLGHLEGQTVDIVGNGAVF